MRIEELVLEGFKSYPVRTQINNWDPSFNAITGLNGSGKSNILDAIAFVLGLTNMSTASYQLAAKKFSNASKISNSLDACSEPAGLDLQTWASRDNQS